MGWCRISRPHVLISIPIRMRKEKIPVIRTNITFLEVGKLVRSPYSSSHNHGSWVHGFPQDEAFLYKRVIFHLNDYGRKGSFYSILWYFLPKKNWEARNQSFMTNPPLLLNPQIDEPANNNQPGRVFAKCQKPTPWVRGTWGHIQGILGPRNATVEQQEINKALLRDY